jgi:IS30 family transposase
VSKHVAAKSERQKRAKRIARICTDAQLLGVSRQHLYAVLTQKRKGSKSLLSRYQALQELQRANTANRQNHTATQKPQPHQTDEKFQQSIADRTDEVPKA